MRIKLFLFVRLQNIENSIETIFWQKYKATRSQVKKNINCSYEIVYNIRIYQIISFLDTVE